MRPLRGGALLEGSISLWGWAYSLALIPVLPVCFLSADEIWSFCFLTGRPASTCLVMQYALPAVMSCVISGTISSVQHRKVTKTDILIQPTEPTRLHCNEEPRSLRNQGQILPLSLRRRPRTNIVYTTAYTENAPPPEHHCIQYDQGHSISPKHHS